MQIFDINGKKIKKGMYAKYIGTHTVGRIDRILIKKGYAWIKLDSSGLYYRNDYIESIEDKGVYIKPKKSSKPKSEGFDIEIPVEISDINDGPGVGGG